MESWSHTLTGISESTSIWESHMASALHRLSGDHITKKDAEDRARKALEMDAGNWHASYTLARIIESDDEAIEILGDITSRLSDDKTWLSDPNHKSLFAEMLLELGDRRWHSGKEVETAILAYSTSLSKDMSHCRRYLGIISRYAERELWTQIVSFLETLRISPRGKTTPIGQLVVEAIDREDDFTSHMLRAAKVLDRWDLLRSIYETALKECTGMYKRSSAIWIKYAFGEALMSDPKQEDEGLRMWEAIVEDNVPSFCSERLHYTMVSSIMPVYTRRALSDGESESTYNKKVDALSQRFYDIPRRGYLASMTDMYFARYHFRRRDLGRAKMAARSVAVQALEMISNDDPSDDLQSFHMLQSLFSTLGDDENEQAAWDMIAVAKHAERQEWEAAKAKWQKKKTETASAATVESDNTVDEKDGFVAASNQEEGDCVSIDSKDESVLVSAAGEASPARLKDEIAEEPPEPDGTSVYCDGCGYMWSYPSGIWTCRDDCGNVQFDDKCYNKLQAGTLEKRVCDKDHEFFHVPEQELDKILDVGKGQVRVGGALIALEEWKRRIATQYVDFDQAATDIVEN